MTRAWPWLMLAACSSQGSIELIVTAPGLPVTNVELFIGVEDEHLEKIRPQHGTLAHAVWWRRDRSQSTDFVPLGPDGSVRYQLVNGGTLGDSLAAFVVVGYDASDTPIAVRSHMLWTDISDDMIERYEFVLGPAQPTPGSTDVPGVQVWGPQRRVISSTEIREADPHACVQVDSVEELGEYKDSGTVPTSGMIVTADDPDCDGLVDTAAPDYECATNEYMGRGQLRRSGLQCGIKTTFVEDGSGLPGCVVGGGACVDGTKADETACTPSTYCMLTGSCDGCPMTGCDPYIRPANAPYIKCYVFATGGGLASDFCALPTRLDLSALLPSYNLACDPDPERPAMVRKDRTTSWMTEMYPIENDSFVADKAFLEVKAGGGNCQYDFIPSGPRPAVNTALLGEFGATLSVPLGTKEDGRGLLFPINFQVVPPANNDCSLPQDAMECDIVGWASYEDVGLRACLAAPIVPGTQVRD